jgi:hypothetical protein
MLKFTSTSPYVYTVLYVINDARDISEIRILYHVNLRRFVDTWLIRKYNQEGTIYKNT